MSDNCPICGCKTEALDFTDCELGAGKVLSACSFCTKQVAVLRNTPEDAVGEEKYQSALRWLDLAVEKDVPGRSEVLVRDLRALYPKEVQPKAPPAPQGNAAGNAPVNKAERPRQRSISDAQRIEELEKRLIRLEKSFKNYKRNRLIFSILGLLLPLLIAGITLIIFFNSDLWDTFISMVSPSIEGIDGLMG